MKLTDSPSKRNLRAFTLVEVMVGLSLMIIAVTSLIVATVNGLRAIRLARDELRATQIMGQRLEVLRLFKWSQITNESYLSTASFVEYGDPNSTTTNKGQAYYGQYSLLTYPYTVSYSSALKMVRVTLTWTNGTRRTGTQAQTNYVHVRTMDTLVCSNGLQNYIY